MDKLKEIIQTIFPLSESAFNEIANLVDYKDYKLGDCFIEKGKRNHHEYFLMEGICRSYLLSPDGEEVTISFYNPGSALSPFVTRTMKNISSLNFQALTDIQVGIMDSSGFEKLMVDNLEIREFGNTVLKMELQKKVDKEIQMASYNAKDRLLHFRKQYPGFENLVPHPAIATFLGITNVSLSRLRKDLSGK